MLKSSISRILVTVPKSLISRILAPILSKSLKFISNLFFDSNFSFRPPQILSLEDFSDHPPKIRNLSGMITMITMRMITKIITIGLGLGQVIGIIVITAITLITLPY